MLDLEMLDLSKARLSHAEDCLKESKILLDSGEYRGAANRAYYAAFHAIRAVLVFNKFDSKKHSGIIAKFQELYLKTNIFEKSVSDAITSLFRVRTASDYDDFYVVSKQDAADQYDKAQKIFQLITNFLLQKYNLS